MKKIDIGVNLTRRCNIQCPWCYYSTLHFSSKDTFMDPNYDLDISMFMEKTKNIDKFEDIYLTGGEPLMYPELRKFISKVVNKSSNIYVCTNALLIDEDWCVFFHKYNIILVVSVKDNKKSTYDKLRMIYNYGIRLHLYIVLNELSIDILREIAVKYSWANKIRLLYETSSNKKKKQLTPEKWFTLLHLASYYLKPIIEKVEVEIGFVSTANEILNNDNRFVVNRIILDYNGKFYPCPLLVENNNGANTWEEINKCNPDKCPVLNSKLKNYKQICPFNIVKLESVKYE